MVNIVALKLTQKLKQPELFQLRRIEMTTIIAVYFVLALFLTYVAFFDVSDD
jgi:hypothetical protein